MQSKQNKTKQNKNTKKIYTFRPQILFYFILLYLTLPWVQ